VGAGIVLVVEVNFEFFKGLIVKRAVSQVLVSLEAAHLREKVLCTNPFVRIGQHASSESVVGLKCRIQLFLIKRIWIFLINKLRTIFTALRQCKKLRVSSILFKF
jgi:hypothetical protein